MKQFVKALDKSGQCFTYLIRKFPHKSEAKLKEGIFDGPEIRKMFHDENFTSNMSKLEKNTWISFRNVAEKFLGNNKSYVTLVKNMVRYKYVSRLLLDAKT